MKQNAKEKSKEKKKHLGNSLQNVQFPEIIQIIQSSKVSYQLRLSTQHLTQSLFHLKNYWLNNILIISIFFHLILFHAMFPRSNRQMIFFFLTVLGRHKLVRGNRTKKTHTHTVKNFSKLSIHTHTHTPQSKLKMKSH